MSKQIVILALVTLLLVACSSAPRKVETRDSAAPVEDRVVGGSVTAPGGGGYLAGDGPGVNVPANLDETPDAMPKSEPLHRYANRPYMALGKTYTPQTVPGKFKQRGIASWYGKKFHGQRTSSGETYDMYGMTAAHPTLPIPSYARVTNVSTHKSVVVRVNDRGPFLHERVMDLSYTAAHKLGIVGNGSSEVEIESLMPSATTTAIAAAELVQSKSLGKQVALVKSASPVTSATPDVGSGNIYLQLGAFKSQDAAESFMAKISTELGDVGKKISVYLKDGLVRVHVGPYANQNEARSSAEGLKGRLGFKPMMNLH